QVKALIINANGDASRFAPLGLPVVPDTIGGFVGPLAGVLAGMRWSVAHAPSTRWIATAAGDAPLLPADLVDKMVRAVADRPGATAPAPAPGEPHPGTGPWPLG